MAPSIILSSCGTSVLTNQTPAEVRSLLFKTANDTEAQLSEAQWALISEHIQTRFDQLNRATTQEAAALSAELNALIAHYGGAIPEGCKDQHFLLASDTFQGRAVANGLATWLQRRGITASVHTVRDLATRNLDEFRVALAEVGRWCEEVLPEFQRQGWRVVFNLTGGFKGVQGYLQTLGMFYADESIYIFQHSSQLLRIPRLPVKLDAESTLRAHLDTFRRLSAGYDVPTATCAGIPETMLLTLDGEAALSEWGELIWQRSRNTFYGERLLTPLSSRIRLEERFKRGFESLPQDRKVILNGRLDQLSQYLDSGRRQCPKSLTFKSLAGKPVPGQTHEFYAWSDRDARRCFGHFEGGTFVVAQLGAHL